MILDGIRKIFAFIFIFSLLFVLTAIFGIIITIRTSFINAWRISKNIDSDIIPIESYEESWRKIKSIF